MTETRRLGSDGFTKLPEKVAVLVEHDKVVAYYQATFGGQRCTHVLLHGGHRIDVEEGPDRVRRLLDGTTL